MDKYVLVEWPESQTFMEEGWFDSESVLSANSSYFIPLDRYYEFSEELKKEAEAINFAEYIKENNKVYEKWSRNKITTEELYEKFKSEL